MRGDPSRVWKFAVKKILKGEAFNWKGERRVLSVFFSLYKLVPVLHSNCHFY